MALNRAKRPPEFGNENVMNSRSSHQKTPAFWTQEHLTIWHLKVISRFVVEVIDGGVDMPFLTQPINSFPGARTSNATREGRVKFIQQKINTETNTPPTTLKPNTSKKIHGGLLILSRLQNFIKSPRQQLLPTEKSFSGKTIQALCRSSARQYPLGYEQ